MRPPELDEATRLAKRLGDPVLAEILERIELPDHYEELTERYCKATAAMRAREQLDDMKAEARKACEGKSGEQAKAVAAHWAGKEGVDVNAPEKASPAALGRLHYALSRLPRDRRGHR